MTYPTQPPVRGPSDLMEVFDRVLDRGIVIDAEMRFSLAGLNVAGLDVRIVVAAIETYLGYADEIALTAPASWRTIPHESDAEQSDEARESARNRLRSYLDDLGETPWLTGES